jgi:hypothetical protein
MRPRIRREVRRKFVIDECCLPLINAQPLPDRCKLNKCEVVGRELVVAGCNTPTVLDLIKEPLDQISCSVKIGAEAKSLCSIPFRRNIRPGAVLADKRSDPVGVIDPGRRRDKSLAASRLSCASPVVSASRTGKPLLSTTACPPRGSAHGLSLGASDASGVLMNAHNRCVDHLKGQGAKEAEAPEPVKDSQKLPR